MVNFSFSFSIYLKFQIQIYFYFLLSVNSISEFKFQGIGNDTKCLEIVEYECPILFSSLCYKEVMYQRQEIMKNLQLHFDKINVKK